MQALISAFGTGVHDDFDIEKLRYYKIVLMADADVDGQHISTLLLTLLFRFMKPLVENGHIFLAQPPLYKLKWQRSEPEFAYSDRERDGLVAVGRPADREPGEIGAPGARRPSLRLIEITTALLDIIDAAVERAVPRG